MFDNKFISFVKAGMKKFYVIFLKKYLLAFMSVIYK